MPRETLNRDQIVEAAIELLDAEGVEGLSMRRLGKRLGSAATAVYWHVGSKENLVVLAADRVWGEIELLDPVESGWRVAARALVQDTYAMVKRHPWLVPAISTHFVYGPGMARFQDHSYAIYEVAGFKGRDLDWAVNAAFTFVAGTALLDATQAAVARAGDSAADVLAEANEIASRYPRLRARLEERLGADPVELLSEKFAFGVEVILDGLTDRLRGEGARPPVTRERPARPSDDGAAAAGDGEDTSSGQDAPAGEGAEPQETAASREAAGSPKKPDPGKAVRGLFR
ncbi:TetR/AcrR family transcriptional regulator [Streptomyces sp. NPDC001340]